VHDSRLTAGIRFFLRYIAACRRHTPPTISSLAPRRYAYPPIEDTRDLTAPSVWDSIGYLLKLSHGGWGQKGCFSVSLKREFSDLPLGARESMIEGVMHSEQQLERNLCASRLRQGDIPGCNVSSTIRRFSAAVRQTRPFSNPMSQSSTPERNLNRWDQHTVAFGLSAEFRNSPPLSCSKADHYTTKTRIFLRPEARASPRPRR
jgi:hypothetical protein